MTASFFRLRNGESSRFIGKSESAAFPVLGRRGGDGPLELWTAHGHWREDASEHPLDIVRCVTDDGREFQFSQIVP